MLRSLLSLVAPPTCLACGAPGNARLCRDCREELPWLGAQCRRCALPRPCGRPCPAARAAFAGAWAPLAFDGPARALVHALKFRGALAAAGVMAAQMAANAPSGLLAGAVLVPVPADAARRRSRGFAHAELLARAVGRRTGLPVSRCLVRHGPSERHVGAGRAARLRSGATGWAASAAAPARALLVDDVHTTGATLDACARVLTGAGAGTVVGLTYARTLG